MTDDEDLYEWRLRQVMADSSLLFKDDEVVDILHHFSIALDSPESPKEFIWDSSNRVEYETEQYEYDVATLPMEDTLMDLSTLP